MIGCFQRKPFLLFLSIILLALISGCKLKTWEEPSAEPEKIVEQILQAETPGETNIFLSAYQNKIVLLDFWATWSQPCRSEASSLQQLYQELKSPDFEIVGMNVDRGNPEKVKIDIAQWNIPYPVMPARHHEKLLADIRVVPTKLLLDRAGNVYKKYVGIVSKEELKTDIVALLNQ